MKAVKIIVVMLAVAALLIGIAYQLRNHIILRLSGPYLQDYGIELTDVSLDALSTSDATIRYLEIQHSSGATVEIRDLRLPLRSAPDVAKSFAAREVSIMMPAADPGEPAALADAVRQLLALPEGMPNTELAVAKLTVSSYPPVQNLEWRLNDRSQSFSASVGSLDLHAEIVREDATRHAAALTIGDRFLTLAIANQGDSVSLQGTSTLQLPAALGLARAFAEVVPELQVVSGTAELQFQASLPSDTARAAEISFSISPTTAVHLVHTAASGTMTEIEMAPASPVTVQLELEHLDWTLAQAHASLQVSTGQWKNLPVSLRNIACRSDLSCAWELELAAGNARLGPASAATLGFSASQRLAKTGDALRVIVEPGAMLTLGDLAGPGVSAGRVHAVLTSEAAVESGPTGWQLVTETAELNIAAMQLGELRLAELRLLLETVKVTEIGGVLAADLDMRSAAPGLRWRGHDTVLPEFSGSIALQDEELQVHLSPRDHDGTDGPLVGIRHNLDTESGSMLLRRATLDFSGRKLSERLLPWPYPWDIADGQLAGELQLTWDSVEDELQFTASSSIELSQIAGAYDDSAFAGLSTQLQLDFTPQSGLVIAPAKISVRLLDVGLSIEDLRADYTLDANARTVRVENLGMRAFGGVVRAEPFSYDSAADSNNMNLEAASIALTELLTLEEFEDIELSGSISAILPVTIEGKSVTISGGKLMSEEPGGVIRYLPGLVVDESSTSSIGLVTRALSNFEYETLESDVDYSKDGDLKLQMRLTGRNPDIENGRPVVLNLGVENNVPAMLKSLQAARSVEEILERRMAQ